MAHDAFISYATPDKATADAVCARLEQHGIRCWIAPRDILPGAPWKPSIVAAIHASRALVLIFSAHANESTEVPKEVDQAVKRGLSIVTFRIENVPPVSGLDYELHGRHWLDALTRPLERHIDQLTLTLNALLGRQLQDTAVPPVAVLSTPAAAGHGGTRRVLVGGILVLVAAAAAVVWFATPYRRSPSDAPRATVETPPPEAPAGPQPGSAPVAPTTSGQSVVSSPSSSPRRGAAVRAARPTTEARSSAATPVNAVRAATDRPADVPRPAGQSPLPPSAVSESAPKPGNAPDGEGQRLVGCWGVGSGAGQLVVRSDHSFTSGGVITGRWDEAGPIFLMQFPDDIGQAELSIDGRRLALTGKVTYTLVRAQAGAGIVGAWSFGEGNPLPVTFAADSSFQVGAVRGKWNAAGRNARVFALTWPGSRYSTVISPDNQSLTMSDPAYGSTTVLRRLSCGAPPGR